MSDNASKIAAFNQRQAASPPDQKTSLLSPPTEGEKQQLSTKEELANKAAHTKEVEKQQQKEVAQQKLLEEQQAQQTQDALKLSQQALGNLQGGVDNQVNKARNFLTSVPTPGGIASMLIILVFFLFFLVPVNDNGDTRAKLIYMTLTGKTHLSYSNIPPTTHGASGDFSTPALTDAATEVQGQAKAGSGGPDTIQNGTMPLDPAIQQIDLMSFLFQGMD